MSLRSEPRLSKEAAVRIFGLDSKGKPVNQHAKTIDISQHGVRLSGVSAWEYPGESVGITYEDEKCRYRVVWVGLPGTRIDGQIGLSCLETGKYIWESALSNAHILLASAALPVPSRSIGNHLGVPAERQYVDPRRKDQRFVVSGGAQVCEVGREIPQWTKLHDLSMGGCYVETTAPLPVYTLVDVVIQVNNIRIEVRGFVTVKHPLVGMGLKFSDLSPLNRDRLHHLLGSIERSLVQGSGY
jgi:PilZ domain